MSLLPHAVEYYALTGLDADNNGTYAAKVDVSVVRCEPVKAWIRNGNGENKDDKLTLYYDGTNSAPAGVTFTKGDKVIFSGAAYAVREVRDFSPHHVEVSLK